MTTPTPPPESRPPIDLLDDDLRRILKIIGIMVIVAGGLYALHLAWPVISMVIRTTLPFAVGLILAYIFNPVVTFFQKKLRLSRIGGVLFLYLVFILAITGFFAIVLPILITQVQSAYVGISSFLSEQIQRYPEFQQMWERVREWLEERNIVLEDLFREAAQSEGMRTAAFSGLRVVGDAMAFLYYLVQQTVGLAIALTFVVLVNIYLLLDFSRLRQVLEVLVPSQHQERTFDVLAKMDIGVGGFIRGMMIDAALVGLMHFVGLYLLGMQQYALLIGVIAAIGAFIPYLGPIAGGTPAMLYVLFSDSYDTTQERLIYAALVLGLLVLIQTIEGFIIQPKIVGKAAQLHPIAVIFAIAMGANFGILGMIVAVPIACVIRVLLKEFYWDTRQEAWEKRTGRKFGAKPRLKRKPKAK